MMEKNKLAMIMFIFSEAVFFTMLILAYVYFHGQVTRGLNTAALLDPLRTGIFSLFLFSSSFTVWRAGVAHERGQHTRQSVWLFITILFGLVFLSGQAIEWTGLFGQGATISNGLFGTTFFTLTGFHGMHVLIGLIMLAVMLVLSLRGGYKTAPSPSVDVISLYWHFVDLVWVFIFGIVYLAGAL